MTVSAHHRAIALVLATYSSGACGPVVESIAQDLAVIFKLEDMEFDREGFLDMIQ